VPEILKISPEKPDPTLIAKAVNILRMGGVVAYPTETFYGLGVDGNNQKAIEKIFLIKGRKFNHPISVIIGNMKNLKELIEEPSAIAGRLMENFWPGALTLVFRASPSVHPHLIANTGKIGIRISSHPIASALAKTFSHPITATSANRSGEMECTTASAVIQSIGADIDAVIDGGTTPGIMGSTIIDVTIFPPKILRNGIIPESLIHSYLYA
jgi:L-threonylcarbamoyladenylate synthase